MTETTPVEGPAGEAVPAVAPAVSRSVVSDPDASARPPVHPQQGVRRRDRRANSTRVDDATLLRVAASAPFGTAAILCAGAEWWFATAAIGVTAVALLISTFRAAAAVVLVVGAALVMRAMVAFFSKHEGLARDRSDRAHGSPRRRR